MPLVDEESGKVTARICHIKAQSEGGARYDASQSDDERHDFENLVLMCPIHHDVIDSDEISYTVERLIQIKTDHENNKQSNFELNDETIKTYIENSQEIVNLSSAFSHGQQGGQAAQQINNYLQQPESANSWEQQIQAKRYEHDLKIFLKSDEIMSESMLGDLIYFLTLDRYKRSLITPVREFQHFFSLESIAI